MTTGEAQQIIFRGAGFRLLLLGTVLSAFLGFIGMRPGAEVEATSKQWPLWQPHGIGFGTFHLTPGKYRIWIDPGYANEGPGVVQVVQGRAPTEDRIPLIQETQLEFRKHKIAWVPLQIAHDGSYVVRASAQKMGGFGMMHLKVYRPRFSPWPFFLLSLGLGALLIQSYRVQLRTLRGEAL